MEAAGTGAGVIGAGAAACAGLGAGCFLAAANAGDGALVGRGEGNGGVAAVVVLARVGEGVDVPGSGVMMLTGGVEAALGNSALVGLPVGTPGTSAATGTLGVDGGAFQSGA